jgi:hypothetical protein
VATRNETVGQPKIWCFRAAAKDTDTVQKEATLKVSKPPRQSAVSKKSERDPGRAGG